MEEYSKFVTIKESQVDEPKLSIVDIDDSFEVKIFEPTFKLIEKTDTIKNEIIDKIVKLSNKHDKDIIEKFSLTKHLSDPELEKKITSKVFNATYYVASNGRIGKANTVLVSEENDKKYNLSELFRNNKYLKDIEIVYGDVEDIYVYRKNQVEQPGLVLIYNEDKYYIADIGFYPYRQFMVIKL